MIRFDFRGVRFTVPLLSLLAPLLAIKLGLKGSLYAVFIALGIHETAHLIAAFILRVNISEVRILPFGGSMRMENPYHIRTYKLALVSAAGPLANFMMLLLISACAQWNLLQFDTAKELLMPNVVLFLFNLLPALPLDGGRIMVAALTPLFGDKRALQAGLWCGRILSMLLLFAMVYGGIYSGRWNISFAFAAIFIVASEKDEKRALDASKLLRLSEAMSGIDMCPAKVYQIESTRSASEALSLLRPKENAWFAITKSGRPHSLLDSRSIMEYAIDHSGEDAKLESIPSFRLCVTNEIKINSR